MVVERKIYVLYTGGTFGMKPDSEGRLVPQPLEVIRKFIIDHTILYERKPGETEADVMKRIIEGDFIVLHHQLANDCPKAKGKDYRILYKFDEIPPIDSSCVTPKNWADMAKKIRDNQGYDGFVLIHGTDTMAYTSSALSFILSYITKTVILTGAQIPIFQPRTDGLDNFVGSMLIAGYFCDIPELHKVMLYDRGQLFQGNRVVKSDSLSAFDSPDVFPLATLGPTVKLIFETIERKKAEPKAYCHFRNIFTAEGKAETRILRFFPGITYSYVRGVLDGAAGVVLESYGRGNVPTFLEDSDGSKPLLDLLKAANKRGVLMLNCTQVYRGTVSPIYDSSKILDEAGVIPGYDITPEAAVAKLIWVVHSEWDSKERREILGHSVYGESCAPPLLLDWV